MKLQDISYSNSDKWYTPEFLPDNRRNILIYSEDSGTSEGYYEKGVWYIYKWNCKIEPKFWRELPRYENTNSKC